MRLSAGKQLKGKITTIQEGAVNGIVFIRAEGFNTTPLGAVKKY